MMDLRNSLLQTLAQYSKCNLINNTLQQTADNNCFPVYDPATNVLVGYSPKTSLADVDKAVKAAQQGFNTWKTISPLERSQALFAAATELENNVQIITQISAFETGRAIRSEVLPEVLNAIRILRYFAGLSLEIKGQTIKIAENVLSTTIREPLGVVAGILPWNVPIMLLCLKLAPAIICGNSIIIKAAELSPFSTIFVAHIIAKHLPQGVLQVVNGLGQETGQFLIAHPLVKKISFTGSVETGIKVSTTAAKKIIPVTLELGGKSPLVVFPDINPKKAAQIAVSAMRFTRQGQSCTAASRYYVHRSLKEPFMLALEEEIAKLKIGDPLLEDTDIGTIISKPQWEKVNSFINEARNIPSVEIKQIGKLPTQEHLKDGLFTCPTLVINPGRESRIVKEEVFGPVTCVIFWEDEQSLLSEINDTCYGLAAYILTNNINSAMKFAQEIEAGYVQINQAMVIHAGVSFGGYKLSGIGREASSESMLESFTQLKTVVINYQS